MTAANAEPGHLQQQPQHGHRSMWDEFTEQQSHGSALPQESDVDSGPDNTPTASRDVSPELSDSRLTADAACPVSLNAGQNDSSLHSCSRALLPDTVRASTSDHACKRTGGLSQALGDSARKILESVQCPVSPWQQPTPARGVVHTNHAKLTLQVPMFSKHKGFKTPAMVSGIQEAQLQTVKAQQQQQRQQQSKPNVQTGICGPQQPAFVFCGPPEGPLLRHAAIPVSFTSLNAYKQVWCAAVTEEINLRYSPAARNTCKAFPAR